MKRFLNLQLILLICSLSVFSQQPNIIVNGKYALASDVTKFPYWLNAGTTLEKGNKVIYIPVLQYNIAQSPNGGNALQFESVILVSSLQTVPNDKAWKIESVILDTTVAAASSGGGDNWGGQVVATSPRLTGNGTGTFPIDIAHQSANIGQSLRWDGNSWIPNNPINVDATLSGDGTPSSPLSIAQQGALNTQVLTWNGSTWVPAVSSGVPAGVITMWSGSISNIPLGWALCDGTNGTPDLLDKFVLGVNSSSENPGITGGNDSITLNVDQLPAHSHTGSTASSGAHTHSTTISITGSCGSCCSQGQTTTGTGNACPNNYRQTDSSGAHTHTLTTDDTGIGKKIDVTPRYFKVAYIIKL